MSTPCPPAESRRAQPGPRAGDPFAQAQAYRSQRQTAASRMTGSRADTRLTKALRQLSGEFWLVVYRAGVAGFGYRKIAGIMGCPLGIVMSRLHRARIRLRAQLVAGGLARGAGDDSCQPSLPAAAPKGAKGR